MYDNIQELEQALLKCQACALCDTEYNCGATSYNGSSEAKLMIVGEGPGQVEDEYGVPLVGKSGQLLDKALMSVGVTRDCVYTTNVVKCRPKGNRTPSIDEGEFCANLWLQQEIMLIKPVVIVALGSVALRYLLDKDAKITRERGKWFKSCGDIDTIATYHPAYLLRQTGEQLKKAKWDVYYDLTAAVERVQQAVPGYKFSQGSITDLLGLYSDRRSVRISGK